MKSIAAERALKGLSQDELAQLLGVSRQALSRWESGKCNPPVAKVIQMANIFGCTADYLLGISQNRVALR